MPSTETNGIDLQIDIDHKGVDLLLSMAESALLGTSLRHYLDRHMAPYLRRRAAARFASEGDDASGAWAPLHEATIAIREAKGYGAGPINKRTGDLQNFMLRGRLDYTMSRDSSSMFYPGTPSGTELKQKVRTAQMGRTNPQTVPRPVAAANAVDMAYFTADFAFWFADQVGGRFNTMGGSSG